MGFQGGMSQMIEFDEVVATTGNNEGQVLGELAGRGYARQPRPIVTGKQIGRAHV